MNVLITGGAGFIGSHTCDLLIENGYSVRVLDSLSSQIHKDNKVPNYLNSKIELVIGDIRNKKLVSECLKDIDFVIHNAACVGVGQSMYEIDNYVDINCRGSAILFEEILKVKKQIKKIIIASSMSVYGEGSYLHNNNIVSPELRSIDSLSQSKWELEIENEVLIPQPTNEHKTLAPGSVYAITKRDQEEMFLILGKEYEIPVVAFRYFNVIGSRQALSNPYTGVAAIFCSRILNSNQPLIFEDGLQMRDFVHVKDVARANLLALENNNAANNVYNIGSGTPITIKDLAKKIAKALGSHIEPQVTGKYRSGDIRHCFADISKANKDLGYVPESSIDLAIAETVEWVRGQIAEDQVDMSYNILKEKNLLK